MTLTKRNIPKEICLDNLFLFFRRHGKYDTDTNHPNIFIHMQTTDRSYIVRSLQ